MTNFTLYKCFKSDLTGYRDPSSALKEARVGVFINSSLCEAAISNFINALNSHPIVQLLFNFADLSNCSQRLEHVSPLGEQVVLRANNANELGVFLRSVLNEPNITLPQQCASVPISSVPSDSSSAVVPYTLAAVMVAVVLGALSYYFYRRGCCAPKTGSRAVSSAEVSLQV